MHEVKHLVVTFAQIIIVVVLAVFAVGNIRSATYNFAGTTFVGNVWWTVAGSALLGFLFAVLLLVPGRASAGLRGRALSRQQERNAQDVMVLRREHERLRGQYAQVVGERDQYRAMLASATPASQTTTANGATPPADNTVMDTQPRADTAPDSVPSDQPATSPENGWRGAFRLRRSGGETDETQTPTGTPAPTA